MKYEEFLTTLNTFHVSRVDNVLGYTSPLAGDAFPGEFNVSGFHKEILVLPENAQSLWGTDRCLRVQDHSDDFHAHIFHMGIFAKSVDRAGEFSDPWKDEVYANLQTEVCDQLFELLEKLGVSYVDLEATVGGRVSIGGGRQGRDSLLDKSYSFGPDTHLSSVLKDRGVKVSEISGLANVDIHPVDGDLVGLRCELAYKGVEIATIVFDSFKISEKHLQPINYVGGYALGVDRLYALLHDGTIHSSIPRYQKASAVLLQAKPDLSSSLVRQEYLELLYGCEALALLSDEMDLTDSQKQHLRRLQSRMEQTGRVLGVEEDLLRGLIDSYKNT